MMTEQELLDIFIQERINILIDTFLQKQPDQPKKECERILHAEIFIENLPSKEKELVENYIDSLISQFSFKEAFVYQHGFMDGVKLLKYISKL